MQLWQALRATINMISVTPWVRTCFTRWRRTTVSPVSAAARCDPSPSVSSITLDRRSSPSPVLWNACPASSHVVCKRWSKMVKVMRTAAFVCRCNLLWYRPCWTYFVDSFFSPSPLSAGDPGSSREHSGICSTTVAPLPPQVHHPEWAQRAGSQAPGAVLWLELPARRGLWGTSAQTLVIKCSQTPRIANIHWKRMISASHSP